MVAILARKLVTYVLIYASQPAFVNYKFIEFVSSDAAKCMENFETFDRISLSDVDLSKIPEQSDDSKRKSAEDERKPKPDNELEILAATPRVSPKRCKDATASNTVPDSVESRGANESVRERDDTKYEVSTCDELFEYFSDNRRNLIFITEKRSCTLRENVSHPRRKPAGKNIRIEVGQQDLEQEQRPGVHIVGTGPAGARRYCQSRSRN